MRKNTSFLARFSVAKKMLLIIALVITAFVGMLLFSSRIIGKTIEVSENIGSEMAEEAIYEQIKLATDGLAESVAAAIKMAETLEEKKEIARACVNEFRYEEDQSGYFFIFQDTVTVAHPQKPSLIGKDLNTLEDPNGVRMIVELDRAAKRGGDFVRYVWAKNGVDTPKVSYARMIPDSPFMIGTGVYLDSVEETRQYVSDAIHAESDKLAIYDIIFGFCLITMTACAVFFTSRSITKPLEKIESSVFTGSSAVSDAARHISQAGQRLAHGSSEQAASIEETSASLDEVSSIIRLNAEHATNADKLMAKTRSIVTEANTAAQQLTSAMSSIQASSEETQKIIRTIDEIAFQTNLLALNAAVEAARAGEAGAGFAVVADEVRNLAIRAAEAAKDTSDMIEGSVSKINEGTSYLDNTNTAFNQVGESTAEVANLLSEIARASAEQAEGISQINTAVNQMDSVTQKNAADAEETAASAEELSAQSTEMRNTAATLSTLIHGSNHVTEETVPSAVETPKPTVSSHHREQFQSSTIDQDSFELDEAFSDEVMKL